MRAWLPCLLGLASVIPASVAAQARIEAIIPADGRIAVQPLGADRAVLARIGMELMPGDLISSTADSVLLELRCGVTDSTNAYLVTSPFRVLVDVPTVASCHINLLSGLTEVVAEAPTETSAGGVTLGSTGTQYAVESRRSGDELILNCFVYDDTVRVLGWSGMQAVAGTKLVWADREVVITRNTAVDLTRSAATYAKFDLGAAARDGGAVPDNEEAYRQLTTLHYEVLANPTNTSKRVELAKEQIKYKVNDQAAYNLKRVDVQSDADLRRYQIDPAVVRTSRDPPAARAETRVTPEIGRSRATTLTAQSTDADLRLIAAGRFEDAIRNLDARVRAGNATSRDYYALARAHSGMGADVRARSNAGRALVLHSEDNRLSAAELRALGELISRQD